MDDSRLGTPFAIFNKRDNILKYRVNILTLVRWLEKPSLVLTLGMAAVESGLLTSVAKVTRVISQDVELIGLVGSTVIIVETPE